MADPVDIHDRALPATSATMLSLLLWTGAMVSTPCVDMGRTVSIVVPYRQRPFHLRQFRRHMASFWKKEFPCDNMWIYVVEQNDAHLFNRAALGNVGILEVIRTASNERIIVDCIVFHDVDLVPEPNVPYTTCTSPIQLGSELENHAWSVPYDKYAGGVVSMRPQDWVAINGMSTKFRGWGGEDDDLHRRLKGAGLLANKTSLYRPPQGHGRFKIIDETTEHHPRNHNHSNYWNNVKLLEETSSWQNDGLTSTQYAVTEFLNRGNYTHLKVNLHSTAL